MVMCVVFFFCVSVFFCDCLVKIIFYILFVLFVYMYCEMNIKC